MRIYNGLGAPVAAFERLGMHRSRILALGAVGVTLMAALGEIESHDPVEPFRNAAGLAFDTDCDDPTATEAEHVRAAFTEAANLPTSEFRLTLEAFADRQAQRYGFTLVNDDQQKAELQQATTVDQAVDAIDDFTENYGIKFGIKTKSYFLDVTSAKPISKDDLRIFTLQADGKGLMEELHFIPKELVQLGGVKDIKLTGDIEGGHDAGIYQTGRDEIDLDKKDFANDTDVVHELTHPLDKATCGYWGRKRDPSFKALNPSGFKYGANNHDTRVVSSNYGGTNVVEDKAEIGRNLLGGDPQVLNDPILKRKAQLLLGRFEHRLPRISNYVAAINRYMLLAYTGNLPRDKDSKFTLGSG